MRSRVAAVVDRDQLAEILRPRTGLIAERQSGPGRWEQEEGATRSYRRSVEAETLADGQVRVVQEVDLRLALPYWSWIFALPLLLAVRRIRPDHVQPWWAPPQRLDRRAAVVLATLAALAVVVGYLGALLSLTMTYAGQEFGVGTAGQGVALGVVRVNVIFALGLLILADRRGRRQVLLRTAAASAVLTGFGALAPSLVWLTLSQVLAVALVAAALVLVGVMAAEEMPAGSRAWAVAVLALSIGLGSGIATMALPLADMGLRGWRWLYAGGLVALPLILSAARRLPESRRFAAGPSGPAPAAADPAAADPAAPVPTASVPAAPVPAAAVAPAAAPAPVLAAAARPLATTGPLAAAADPTSAPPAAVPLGGPDAGSGAAPVTARADARTAGPTGIAGRARVTISSHRGRLIMLSAGAFLYAMFATPSSQFQNQFLRVERSFSALRISAFSLITGTIGSLGVMVGGRLADTRGRRQVAAVGIAAGIVTTVAGYATHGWPLWAWGVAGSLLGYGVAPAIGVYGPELFPTSLRSRATGIIGILFAAGGVLGLVLAGLLSSAIGTMAPALAILAIGPAALVVLIVVAYPETAGRELEQLNPEDDA